MKKIDELIQQYNQEATSYYDDVVAIELDKTKQLYDKYQETNEDIFAFEMVEAFSKIIDKQKERILGCGSVDYNEIDLNKVTEMFCKIIKAQRELIGYLEQEQNGEFEEACDCGENCLMTGAADVQGFIANLQTSDPKGEEGFQDDRQLQAAFTEYCLKNGKSSYTANDYCSRIKNLWKNYYNEYNEGNLDECLRPMKERLDADSPLLNVFNNAELLSRYIMSKIEETEGNRNWTNARAAFNKFDKFRRITENQL